MNQGVDDQRKLKIIMDLLSHDIKNHVHGSMSYIEILQSVIGEDQKEQTYLARSMNEMASISNLIDNLRLLVHIPTESFQGEKVDVLEILEKASDDAVFHINSKRLVISPEFGKGQCIIRADRYLHDMLKQLLMNSLEYSIGEETNVRISHLEMDGVTRIVYEDDGMGIPDNLKGSVFYRFDRSIAQGNVHGKGMGLSLVKTIIERYGGRISLEDIREEGELKGTRFIIDIPSE